MKVVVPVADEKGDKLSEHFGRAPYFAVFEVSTAGIQEEGIYPNKSDHFGGTGHPPEQWRSPPDTSRFQDRNSVQMPGNT